MSSQTPEGSSFSNWIKIVAGIVLLISLSMTFFFWIFVNSAIEKARSENFLYQVGQIERGLKERITSYERISYVLQGFFAASNSVERNEWITFVKTAKFDTYPELSYISFIARVKNEDKQAFIRQFRADKTINPEGYPSFDISPSGVRKDYAILKYSYPEDEVAVKTYGVDLYTNRLRRLELEKAGDTNKPIAGQKVYSTLQKVPAFMMTLPVYANGLRTATIAERRKAISGYVTCVVLINELFTSIVARQVHSTIGIAVYDASPKDALNKSNLLFTNDNAKVALSLQNHDLSSKKTFTVGQRTWTVLFWEKSNPGFGGILAGQTLPSLILVGGFSVSILLFFGIYSLGRGASKLIQLQGAALQAAANSVVITDTKGMIQWVNPAFTKLTGYEARDVIGQSTRILHSGKQDKGFYQDLWNTIQKGNTWKGEIINKRKDGTLYREEQMIAPVVNAFGKVTNYIAIKQDITQRKKTEEKLVASNKGLEVSKTAMLNVMEDLEEAKEVIERERSKDEAILSSIGEGIIAIDKHGVVILINQAGSNLLGYGAEELIGKKFVDLVPMLDEKGERVAFEDRPIIQALSGQKSTTTTISGPIYRYQRKDKTLFPVAITVRIFKSGNTIGVIEVFRDITHALEIDKAKSEFVSVASHQLRTPLGIIKWYLEVMQKDGYLKKAPKNILDYFSEIVKNNERILSLVRELLSISRIEEGRVKNTPASISLTEAVVDIVKEMQVLARTKNILLSYKVKQKNFPNMNIDPLLFHEVIENLVANAIQYTKSGGRVDVEIDKKVDSILISVADNGIGISVEDKKNLFTKFFRSQEALTANPDGSGLGLYVVKSYIEKWGGKISVTSSEGNGTVFLVELPISMRGSEKQTPDVSVTD